MGDMSELRPLVVFGVLMTVFVYLTLQIPTEFATSDDDITNARRIEVLDYWDAGTLQNYADINETVVDPDVSLALWKDLPDYVSLSLFSQELDDGDGAGEVEFGGYEELWLLSRYSANSSEGRIYLAYPLQRFLGGGWVTRWGWAQWYFNNGTSIEINDNINDDRAVTRIFLDDVFDEIEAGSTPTNYTSFKVKCNFESKQLLWFDIHFSYDPDTYGGPAYAWDSAVGDAVPDDFYVLSGINFEQTRTTYDAWNIVEAILFFNLPSILQGTPAFVGYILSVIVWIPMIYVAFILILRSIGALFGGGA